MFKINSLRNKSPEMVRRVSRPEKCTDHEALGQDSLESNSHSDKPKVAVFITHGMGQQIPFETLDSAVEGLSKAAKRQHPDSEIEVRTCTVEVNGNKRQRAEFDMLDAQGKLTEVHVYEGYWAPITEGQVTLRDVISFLFSAGLNGLANSCKSFRRWVMGGYAPYGTQKRATTKLLLTLGILAGLVILNLAIGVVSGDKLLHSNSSKPYFSAEIFNALTSVAGLYMIVSLAFGGLLYALISFKKRIEKPQTHPTWVMANNFAVGVMWLWFASTIISGIWIALIVVTQDFSVECINEYAISKYLSQCWPVIWITLLGVSWKVKALLVQFMGDVAVYIDSHSLDQFSDMRHRIKDRVLQQATDVYTQSQYERIAMVGHSLGSVVTYDTLNALIIQDELADKKLNVIERTSLFLTFGSPLDKTAFIFASQSKNTSATREALAANLQPLIQSYALYRDINWINVYSSRDVISGHLAFYDNDRADGFTEKRRVQNIEDKDALIPLVAHTEYWTNVTLFDQLYNNI